MIKPAVHEEEHTLMRMRRSPGAPGLAFETWESTTLKQPISPAQRLDK